MEAAATAEIGEPQVFTKTKLEIVRHDTSRYPYLTFKLRSGGLQHLIVRIWSHDQGWCDQHLETQDPFANTHTWFSLGLFNEKAPENQGQPDLFEFQRNTRASNAMRCYTHGWNIGVPVEVESSNNEVHGWVESLAEAEGLTIGVFPLAQYAGWENWVWKMEVRVYPRTMQGDSLHEPQPRIDDRPVHDTITPSPDRPHFITVRLIDPEEKSSIVRDASQGIFEDYHDLSKQFTARYNSTGAKPDLDTRIEVAQRPVAATHQDHSHRAIHLNSLGFKLWDRYRRKGEMPDLAKAIETTQQVIYITPRDYPNRAMYLNNLGVQLGEWYKSTGVIADLEKAIKAVQQAVNTTAQDHPNRAVYLNSLGVQLRERYKSTGVIADLEEAIETAQQAVAATPQDDPERVTHLNNLGAFLSDRYSGTGVEADLEKAIEAVQQAVAATPQDHPERAMHLNNLGALLSDRYSGTGVKADLEKAIETAQQAVDATPQGHYNWIAYLNNLGEQLGARYKRTGELLDLEKAIETAQQAVDATRQDHHERATSLSSLGSLLAARYSRTGAMADLEKAIETIQQAVDATPQGRPDRAGFLNNLGVLLGNKYSRTEAMVDLEKAIETAQQVLKATHRGHHNRVAYLNNLGIRLWDRYSSTRAVADLEKAIKTTQQVVVATPEGHPERAMYLNNLGIQLGGMYRETKAISDLEKSIEAAQQAVAATPEDHPDRARHLNILGTQLRRRYSRKGAIADLQSSYQSHLSAFHQNTSPINERISAAQNLLSSPFVLHDQEHALQYASEAIELLPQLTPRALQYADKQHLLVQAAGLASDAAALAVLAGEPARAITWLEAGRGVLASGLQEIRIDLSNLHRDNPTLANTFKKYRNILDAPTRSNLDLSQETTAKSVRNDVDLRRQAQASLDEVIREIRQQPGYERFLLPPAEEELLVTATHGPIVLVNVSRHRCDALIVQSTGIQHCELPSLKYQEIQDHRQSVSLASPSMLEWLWDAVVERVLHTLHLMQGMSAGPWLRLWWIPTGPLVGFPLHAAGYHTARDGRTTLDRVASLYATSVRSLIPLRQQKSSKAARGLVLVNMQDTPGQGYLHHAAREIHQVEETSRSLCLTVTQPEKKKEAVRKALSECQIFHFAGHGGTNARHPLQSQLLLTDWKKDPLTVESLLEMDLQRHAPFLAYLSACGSGEVRDAGSVDESIHLSSACQLAGFRHVIGTLWSVDDALSVEMARLTYEYLAEQGLSDESVSYGIHSASRYLRDEWVREVRKSEGSQDEGGNHDEEGGGSDSRPRRGATLVGTAEASAALWVPYVHYGA